MTTVSPQCKAAVWGQLSALAQAEGVLLGLECQAGRDAGHLQAVEDLLRQLRDRGHIQLEVERDPDTNEVLRRKIWICGPPGASVPPPEKRGGSRENGGTSP